MKLKTYFKNIIYFFPLQLVLAHLKENHLLLLIWLLLFGFASQTVAVNFGIPYLFLQPEYLSHVNWLSYLILGFSIGGFFMAFHLYSYVMLGPSFPFIASIYRPFFKFSLNNSILPISFYCVLVYNIVKSQYFEELVEINYIILHIASLTIGIVSFILIAMVYFFNTNKSAEKMSKNKNLANSFFQKTRTYIQLSSSDKHQPNHYLANIFKIKSTRNVNHYNQEILDKVFKQNHFNAKFFEILTISVFILLGVFQNFKIAVIPASSSILLLLTLFLMFTSFLYSWFKGWTLFVIVFLIFTLNYISTNTTFLSTKNYVYGLNYDKNVDYSLAHLKTIQFNNNELDNDIHHHINILNNWLVKAKKSQNTDKPKLVLINVSGGGIRAAMWTFKVMQSLDKESNGEFMTNTHFITGASGGMIGAAYYRDVVKSNKNERHEQKFLNNISEDLLNRVSFSLVTHDLLLRHKKVSINGREYSKDRGFFFEEELNENTNHLMDYTLGHYKEDEMKSIIPLMLFSPTIINDGRRLLISPQPFGFMNGPTFSKKNIGPENIEFIKLFKSSNPLESRYLSILRMNATFPYVLPMVSLPTQPEIAVMDAGIRDNYGTKSTIRYIDAFEDWIKENTSGIIIVQIRDVVQDYDIQDNNNISLIDKVLQPSLNFYGNFQHAQEFNATELLEVSAHKDIPIYKVSFILKNAPKDDISLSWHLTKKEKNRIINAFESDKNKKELQKIVHLLESN